MSSRPRIFGALPFHTDGELLALGFATDGTLWSVEEPGVLRHWDSVRQQLLEWHGLEELATLWCFGPGCRLVAAGSDELSVWETTSGQIHASWRQPSWVTAIAFRPGSDQIVTGHDDGMIRLWERNNPRPRREFRGHESTLSALRFSHDGHRLASAAEDRVILLWDIERGEITGRLVGHSDRIPALAWLPDGRRLASAGWDTTARLWDTQTCEPIILLNSHADQVHTLALSPDGRLLASADSANAVHVWDLERRSTLTILREQCAEVRCLTFSPDGQRLASGGADHLIHLWDRVQGTDGTEVIDPLLSRTGLAVTPDGRRLLGLGSGTSLRVWDVATGQTAVELEGSAQLRSFAASPDGRWIAGSLAEPESRPEECVLTPSRGRQPEPARNTLMLWNADGKRQAVLEGQAAPITALAFNVASTLLASAGFQSSDVWLWNIPSGQPDLLIPGAADNCSVEALAFQPQGQLLAIAGIDYLATSGMDGVIVLWSLNDRRVQTSLRGGAFSLAFHPSGRRLAGASLVQSVRVWDVAAGHLVSELIGHLDAVTCVAYSPDGRWLASGSDDRTVRLWDAETGLQRGLTELDTQVKAITFAPDGRYLFTGNGNGSCYQLEVSPLLGEGS